MKSGKTIAEKLTKISENTQKVYESGYVAGQLDGAGSSNYNEGFDAGKQAERDAFWDEYQKNGGRTNYQYAFAGGGWTADILKPKYDIKPNRCDYLFASTNGLEGLDLVEHLSKLGVTLDISNATNISSMCSYAYFNRIGALDTRKANSLNSMFANSRLVTVDKLVLRDDGIQSFTYAFNGDRALALADITFEGIIGQDIDFKNCPDLTAQSIKDIFAHLSDVASGKTLTLSQTAVNNMGNDGDVRLSTESYCSWFYSEPIWLKAGQRLKVTVEKPDGHGMYNYTDWWLEFTGPYEGGTPGGYPIPYLHVAQEDGYVTLGCFLSADAGADVIIKAKAVLVDENGNELTGENLLTFTEGTHGDLTVSNVSAWDALVASKPNWTVSLV